MQILTKVVNGRKGDHVQVLKNLKREGYIRVRGDGEMREITEDISLDKNKEHSIEVVVDRIIIKDGGTGRLSDSMETALPPGSGGMSVDILGGEEYVFSESKTRSM